MDNRERSNALQVQAKDIIRKALDDVRALGLKPELDFGCNVDHVSDPSEKNFVFYEPDMQELLDRAKELALDKREATAAYHKQFETIWERVEPLGTVHFWRMFHNYFVPEIKHKIVGRSTVKSCVHNFFCNTYHNGIDWKEPVQFAKTWHIICRRLHDALFDVVEGFSDDGYGDLIDALPLCGEQVVLRCINDEYKTNDEFVAAVKQWSISDKSEGMGLPEEKINIILHGENYFHSTLRDKAEDWMANRLLEEN
jgi:hypothetical protein